VHLGAVVRRAPAITPSRSADHPSAFTGALRRDPPITPSRPLVLFAAIGGDYLRRDQQSRRRRARAPHARPMRHKRIDETMLYVQFAEVHMRPVPETILAAGRGSDDPDRRVIAMLSARQNAARTTSLQ
jgi:hypothetical protein